MRCFLQTVCQCTFISILLSNEHADFDLVISPIILNGLYSLVHLLFQRYIKQCFLLLELQQYILIEQHIDLLS